MMALWLLIGLSSGAAGQSATADWIVQIPADDHVVSMPADDYVVQMPADDTEGEM